MSGDRRDALIVRRRVWQAGAQGWCGLVQVGAGWCRLVAAHGCTARVGIGSEGFRACEGVYDLQAEPLLPLRAAPAQTSGRNSQLRQPQSHASPIPCKLVQVRRLIDFRPGGAKQGAQGGVRRGANHACPGSKSVRNRQKSLRGRSSTRETSLVPGRPTRRNTCVRGKKSVRENLLSQTAYSRNQDRRNRPGSTGRSGSFGRFRFRAIPKNQTAYSWNHLAWNQVRLSIFDDSCPIGKETFHRPESRRFPAAVRMCQQRIPTDARGHQDTAYTKAGIHRPAGRALIIHVGHVVQRLG